jgi:RNA processing factor Prp31
LTFFITPFHYTDCFSVRQIGYGGKPSVKQELENIRKEQEAKKEEKAKPPQRQNKTPGRNRRKKKSKGR